MKDRRTADTMEGKQIMGWMTLAARPEAISAIKTAMNTASARSRMIQQAL